MPQISLPAQFNVAAHFIDEHPREGRGQRIAIECGNEHISYQQLFERVNRAGNALKKLGIKREERVALLLLDSPDFAYSFFGAIKIGAVPIPINTLLRPAEYQYILNDSQARLAIVSETLLPKLNASAGDQIPHLEEVLVSGSDSRKCSLAAAMDQSSNELAAAPTGKDDPAFWLYSSGSTGSPK